MNGDRPLVARLYQAWSLGEEERVRLRATVQRLREPPPMTLGDPKVWEGWRQAMKLLRANPKRMKQYAAEVERGEKELDRHLSTAERLYAARMVLTGLTPEWPLKPKNPKGGR